VLAIAVLLPLGLRAQDAPETQVEGTPGSTISVRLLTMGPGAAVWEVWGHNALWITDPTTGLDVAYNWGMFDFADVDFIPRLARGTMRYWMAGFPGDALVYAYARDNRDVWAQELNLTPQQRLALVDLLRETDTDENRFYDYDYYRDNCSTRVRDALDAVLGGRIAAALADRPTGTTWRWHAQRILREMPSAYVGMHFALGNPADEPITAWDESFLPTRFMEHLRGVTVPDGVGGEAPLVESEVQLFQAVRPPPPQEPANTLPWFLGAGVLLGAALVGLGRWEARVGRAMSWAVAFGWSVAVGTAGLLLLAAWLFTDHTFWYRNENLLQASPLSLGLALLLLASAVQGRFALRWLGPAALAVFGLSLLGLLVQPLPGFDQANAEIIAFALPVHAAVAWVAVQLGRGRRGGGGVRPSSD